MLGLVAAPGSEAFAPDGDGDPVQIAGVVPGADDACWGDEQAPRSTTQPVRTNRGSLAIASSLSPT
jgi:hypothetical protein